ncbi:permease family-domain-containing protein [Protomyces lactucae-debilis]|uniref:Permease family-domain-containing protein n=1 Tax=Protomyces lactucae-debilis TaxID=2754530 RepID=A0A1Y2FQW5_PROLT|nr:permease family-domain-containing protein [Protomyces lactucae-debilis]ORY86390.1 permease family-domain-containing protein [Protomyces lactucae-debilis]
MGVDSQTKVGSFDEISHEAPANGSQGWKRHFSKAAWVGDYDYGFMFRPNLPFIKNPYDNIAQPFFGVDAKLPWLLAALLGFQHALAMLAGVVTPPTIIGGAANLDTATQQYLVSASLIVCGIATTIQITRLHIYKTPYYIGTGLISVAGTSFAVVPIAQKYFALQYARGVCATIDGIKQPCPDAYGKLIGTCAIAALFHIVLAFVPPKTLSRLFPPLITGQVLLFIGASLVSSGIKDWAGSSGPCSSRPTTGIFTMCPTIYAPKPYAWGDAHFLGLGLSVIVSIVLIERFGSPIMKTSGVILGLLVGCIISGATGYWDTSSITKAPAITFVWVKTFKLGVDGTLILPLLAVVLVLVLENIGDVTATCDVSKVEVEGPIFNTRIQGGILADALNSLLSALMTNTSLSTFAQNNGVMACTGVASRRAGYFGAGFLLLAGVLNKVGATFVAIPSPVIGAMKTFLFASVAVSGIRLLALNEWTRRTRFILTCSMSIGLAALLVPTYASYMFTYSGPNKSLRAFYDAIVIVIESPYCVSALISSFLHLVMPDLKEAEMSSGAHALPVHNGEIGAINGTAVRDDTVEVLPSKH